MPTPLQYNIDGARKKNIIFIQLETQNAKTDCKKWNIREKLGKENLDWKSQP